MGWYNQDNQQCQTCTKAATKPLSLGMLDSNGCSLRSEGGIMKVMKGSMVVLKGSLQYGLYVLHGKAVVGVSATVKYSDQTRLWHKRLGHMSLKGMQELCKQGVLDNKLITSLDFCESCVLGKSHRLKFAKGTHTHQNRFLNMCTLIFGVLPMYLIP